MGVQFRFSKRSIKSLSRMAVFLFNLGIKTYKGLPISTSHSQVNLAKPVKRVRKNSKGQSLRPTRTQASNLLLPSRTCLQQASLNCQQRFGSFPCRANFDLGVLVNLARFVTTLKTLVIFLREKYHSSIDLATL